MRLALLPSGSILLDKGRVVTPGRDIGTQIEVPVWCALIETDDGRRIILDTGMHPDHIADPDATYAGTASAGLMLARMTFADLLSNRLQSLGVPTNSIDTVILSPPMPTYPMRNCVPSHRAWRSSTHRAMRWVMSPCS